MAFVFRSKRDFRPVKGETGEKVGPGSYLSNHMKLGNSKYSSAPFNSTKKRKIGIDKDSEDSPGPGSYSSIISGNDIKYQRFRGKSSMFKSNTNRFKDIEETTPGPGNYEARTIKPAKIYTGKKGKRKFAKYRNSLRYLSGKSVGKPSTTSKGNIVWVKVNSAPSIPSMGMSWGYEHGSKGKLVKQKSSHKRYTGTKNSSVGPGDYERNYLSTFSNPNRMKEKNIGSSTFLSRSKRSALGKSKLNIPGPGSYKWPEEKQIYSDPFNKTSSFASTSKRRVFSKLEREKDLPGPGRYDLSKNFLNSRKRIFKKDEVPENFQFFGSNSKRSFQKSSFTPGPGAYEKELVQTESLDFLKGEIGVRSKQKHSHGPFRSTSKRFKKIKNQIPGPGKYNLRPKTMKTEDNRKTINLMSIGKNKKVVRSFGSTSKRFQKDGNIMSPPVGYYNPKLLSDVNPIKKKIPLTSVFASKSKRVNDKLIPQKSKNKLKGPNNLGQKKVVTAPGPGSYFKPSDWVKNKYVKLDSKKIGGRIIPKRFEGTRGSLRTRNNVPGPGEYNTLSSFKNMKNKKQFGFNNSFSQSGRFEKKVGKGKEGRKKWTDVPGPGPGEYGTNETWNKRSFNVTLH